jgi:hypothetical protein
MRGGRADTKMCRSLVSARQSASNIIPFRSSALHHLVPGWWDPEAQRVQRAECSKSPEERGTSSNTQLAKTWRHLCLCSIESSKAGADHKANERNTTAMKTKGLRQDCHPQTVPSSDHHRSTAATALAVAACITGQTRTFTAPCVGPRMVEHLLQPTRAVAFVYLNQAEPTEEDYGKVRTALRGATVGELRIERTNDSWVDQWATCGSYGACGLEGTGTVQYRALAQCYHGLQKHPNAGQWDWVRSDHGIPFHLASLPLHLPHASARHGMAYTGNVAGCDCGFRSRPCGQPGQTDSCKQVDDQFALLHGAAIRAYLHHLPMRHCELVDRAACGTSCECRVATVLNHFNVSYRDIRFVSRFSHPPLVRRHEECGTVPTLVRAPSYNITAESMLQVPPGPWDQRRNCLCADRRRGVGSLCLTQDDDLVASCCPPTRSQRSAQCWCAEPRLAAASWRWAWTREAVLTAIALRLLFLLRSPHPGS